MSEERRMVTLPSDYLPPNDLLTEYIEAAMQDFVCETLEDDGSFFGTVPGFQGAWANADTVDECRGELVKVLVDWIILGIRHGHPIPDLPSVTLMPRQTITGCPPSAPLAEGNLSAISGEWALMAPFRGEGISTWKGV